MLSFIFSMLGLILAGFGIILFAGIASLPVSVLVKICVALYCLYTYNNGNRKTLKTVVLGLLLIDLIGFGEVFLWAVIIFIAYKIQDRIRKCV